MSHPASHFKVLDDEMSLCLLCPQACRLGEGEHGKCHVRHVEDGLLVTDTYERITSAAFDPIEKKPLYHFCPGRDILSIGTFGCNLACSFCQNWRISHESPSSQRLPVDDLVRMAQQKNSIGVAFTYNEPTIWYEYIMAAAPCLRSQGSKIVLVTNGYIMPQPLEEILPYIDAMNIDLKSSRDDFYRNLCGGHLSHVLETIRRAFAKTHVEVTHLIVTGQNDKEELIERVVDYVADIAPGIPLHLSRYFPQYQYDKPATAPEFMHRAYQIAKQRLDHVYVGNFQSREGADTTCPNCGSTVIRRAGYQVNADGLNGNRCANCNAPLNFIVT